jgi:hypothetical protein
MSAAATDTSCFGDTSIRLIWIWSHVHNEFARLTHGDQLEVFQTAFASVDRGVGLSDHVLIFFLVADR